MSDEEQLLEITQRLLDAIASGDWETYCELCDPNLSCFEPEAVGNLVRGMPFHRFYFELAKDRTTAPQTTMTQPYVKMLHGGAIVAYVRLVQVATEAGPKTLAFEETRVWERAEGGWKHIHFHRSPAREWGSLP